MKICIIQYNLGAKSETFLTRHINLLKEDLDVYCITGKVHDTNILDKSKTYVYTKLNLINSIYNRIRCRLNKKAFMYSNSIFKGIHKIKPELIVFQFSFLPVLCYQKIAKLHIPFVIIHHGTDLNNARLDKDYYNRLKLIWGKAASVIFVSVFLYNEALKLGLDKEKAKVIYLGVPSNVKELPTIKNNLFEILSIGRLVPVKNHSLLIRAFKIFNDKYPNSKLTIIGDGHLKDNLVVLINQLSLAESVILTGALDYCDVESYLDRAQVFCLVSKKIILNDTLQEEGLGLTLLEASLRKTPLIGTNSGGIPEVVSHNENGLLVDTENDRELSEALEYLYLNPIEAKIMGEIAYNKVMREFNQGIQIKKFKEVYTQICYDI